MHDTAPIACDYPQPNGGWQMDYCNYDRLQDPLVRDLAWVAWSPPLLSTGLLPICDPLAGSIWRSEPDRLWSQLLHLDADPGARARLLPPTADFRLGTYYERLWQVLLDLAPDVRVLARNLRLQRGGVTLGELDLLLESALGEVLHLELAIKFYMGLPALCQPAAATSPAEAWLGPNPRDSLASKLKRLVDHQLPLIEQFDLASAGLPRPDQSCAWLQGQLFFPLGQSMPAPTQLAPGQEPHRWCGHSAWTAQRRSVGGQWTELPHKRWLMPPTAEGHPGANSDESAQASQRARILIRGDDKQGPLRAQRLMLVADDWPQP